MQKRTFKEVKELFHHLISGTMVSDDFDVMIDVLSEYAAGEKTVLSQVQPENMNLPDESMQSHVEIRGRTSPMPVFSTTPLNPSPIIAPILDALKKIRQPESIAQFPEDIPDPLTYQVKGGIYTPYIPKGSTAKIISVKNDNGTTVVSTKSKKLGPTQQKIIDIIEKYGSPMKAADISKNHSSGIGAVSVCLSKMVKTGLLQKAGTKYGTPSMFDGGDMDIDHELKNQIFKVIKSAKKPISESAIAIRVGDHDDMMFMKALRYLKKDGKISESEHSGSFVIK